MALILKKAYEAYNILFDKWADDRTKDWPLIAKPIQTLVLLGLYLMFVLKWGPKWMKNRKPFNLDKILIAYNVAQVIGCVYLFVNAIWYAWGWHYKWICEPIDYSRNERAVKIAQLIYFYFILKVVDLLDTVFFVLRKKANQVSFLHIYHHTGMVMLIWGAVTYMPGGHGTLIGVINTFVHIVMYSYYLYTVINPAAKQSIWWKKYITQLQILQFFWCVVHMSIIVFKPDCEYPRWTSAVFLPQNVFILILFLDFYIKTYVRKPKVDKQKANQNGQGKTENGVGNGEPNKNIIKESNGKVNYTNGNLTEINGFSEKLNGIDNAIKEGHVGIDRIVTTADDENKAHIEHINGKCGKME